ncbi:MAG: CoA transferase [Desertimonas sp.]
MGPCTGRRVVEITSSTAVAFGAKLLGDLGATVVKLEPPEGDPARGVRSRFVALNTGKSSRVLTPGGDLAAELAAADVVIAGSDDDIRWATGADVWEPDDSSAVVVRISPFGNFGPRRHWVSDDLVQYAMAAWMHHTGRPDRTPLAAGGGLAEMVPGLAGAIAAVMGLRAQTVTGRGQTVDVSQQEALLLCQPYAELGYGYLGVERTRNGMPFPMTIVPAADGNLGINVLTQTQWELLCAFTGHVELLDDERLADPAGRQAHAAELTAVFSEWAADRDRVEVFNDAQEWRIPFGYVPHLDEVRHVAQHKARDFFASVDHGDVTVDHPTLPFLVDGHRGGVGPAPALGRTVDDGHDAGGDVGPSPSVSPEAPEPVADLAGGPMSGLRVVDLSMFWSGPLTAELLAQYGAEVIKVESVQRVDGWRGLSADPNIERSNLFNGVNLAKLGVTIDLTSPEGRALLRPLVETADVLIENFSPRVMGNFGLTDEVLHDWNPDLVVLSMPAFGLTGPWRSYVGFAPTIEQLSGLPELTGYEGGPAELTGNSIADPCAGLAGALALSAVFAARASGCSEVASGLHIDLSQLESLTALLAPVLAAEQIGDLSIERTGNTEPGRAPHGCYPCVGDDRWMVIAADTNDAWSALTAVVDEAWTADDRFTSPADRWVHRHDLDRELAAWTGRHDAVELAERLQAAGVAAAPVIRPGQLYEDVHLAARGSSIELDRPETGRHRYTMLPFKFSATPGRVTAAAPTLGQHNDEVFGGRLGRTVDELAALRAARVIGESIDP